MSTKLLKPVSRECVQARWGSRILVVTLEPGSETEPERVVIREKGRRHSFALPVLAVYRLAAQDAADAARKVISTRRRVNRGLLK